MLKPRDQQIFDLTINLSLEGALDGIKADIVI